MTLIQKIHKAVEKIKKQTSYELKIGEPKIGLVLGSGLGPIAEQVTDAITLEYTKIPYFCATQITGHAGQLILGKIRGIPVVLLKGRFHLYEGHSMETVVFPTQTLWGLGIHTLILTNAAGAVNTRFRPGDLMMIEDHLNLMGDNPLRGAHLAEMGPRFPDLSEAYSKTCLEFFRSAAQKLNLSLQQGVYAGLLGPTYETPAEVRMLRTLGADAVGMSTVPETLVANQLGIQVAGISCITNLAAGVSSHPLNHQDVIEVSKIASHRMIQIITHTLPQLASHRKESI